MSTDAPRRIAVVEAGHPLADSLALLFILFGYGGVSIASHLRRHGYEVRYYPLFAGSRLDEQYLASCDYLLISAMTHTAKIGYAIAERFVGPPGKPPVVIFGGPHPSCEPEDALQHGHFVVVNEGEATILELLRHLDEDTRMGPRHIPGLVFLGEDGEPVYTPPRAPLEEIDFSLEPDVIQDYPGILGSLWRTGRLRFPFPVVQFSRGCPYGCTFCLGARQLGQSYRVRPPDGVIRDLRSFYELTRFPYGMLHDNDVAIRREETKELLRAMVRARPGIRVLSVFTRVESTKDEELWRLFDEAGVANVFLGIESLSQGSLDAYQKGSTVEGIHAAMERLEAWDVKAKVMASFVVGDVDDPRRELSLIREFWNRYHHRLQRVVIQPLMEYPFQQRLRGQPQLYSDERFIHFDWDFFAGDYLVFYPRALPASVFQEELRQTLNHVHGVPGCCRFNLGMQLGQRLIAYTHGPKDRRLRRYIEFLREKERGKYDQCGGLREDRLAEDVKPTDLSIPGIARLHPPVTCRVPPGPHARSA